MKPPQASFSLIARVMVGLVLGAEGLRQINIWPDIAALFSYARLAYPFELGVAMVVAGLLASILFILEFRPRAVYARSRPGARRKVR